MLLKEYLLLNLGKSTPAAALAWRSDMAARRRGDASRDLLCFWRPAVSEGEFQEGTLVAFAVMGARLGFGRELGAAAVEAGLAEAGRKAVAATGAGPAGVAAKAEVADGVVLGRVSLPLGQANAGALANATAFYFEDAFGYAQAAKHPVAYEESLRPTQG